MSEPKECTRGRKNQNLMTRGVIYYNHGTRALLKLMVSIHSLRKVYTGPVTIIAHGSGLEECKELSKLYNVDFKEATVLQEQGRKFVYLNKCLYHKETPYDVTIALDNDTLIQRDFTELFDLAGKNEFAIARFSNWLTTGRFIITRIASWSDIYPDYIQGAYAYKYAINCGVIAFSKNSKLMADWFNLAQKGRNISFIPDEICCQIILHRYPHILVDSSFNTSCKYDKITPETKIIHYHGQNHCKHNSRYWYKEYNEISSQLKYRLAAYDKRFKPE